MVDDMKSVEKYRNEFKNWTDDELICQMHQWVAHSERHVAAKLILTDRQAKRERHRFHLIFWPSLFAAIASVIALLLKI